jgi:hypothetical protein
VANFYGEEDPKPLLPAITVDPDDEFNQPVWSGLVDKHGVGFYRVPPRVGFIDFDLIQRRKEEETSA